MAEAIHVGEGGRKSKTPRWPFVAGLVLVVIVAAGFGAAARWYGVFFKSPERDTVTPLPDVVQDIQDLQLKGQTEESEKKIAELLADPATSRADQYQLYILQGDSLGFKQDFQGAAGAYAKAYEISQTFDAASKLGGAWQGVGDKQKAIEYYKRALQLLPADLPTRESDKQALEESIKVLEEQP